MAPRVKKSAKPKHPKEKGAPGNKAEFLKLFVKLNGNRAKALAKVGVGRNAFYKWMLDETFAEAFEDAKESLIDNAEEVIHDAVRKSKDVEAAKFVVERLGKDRGWRKDIGVKADVVVHAADIIKRVHETRKQNPTQNKEAP